MTSMNFLLAFAFLCSMAYSQDMIWLQTPYPECNSCLDQTFQSCPGNYQDVSYAECMCKGDGSANTNTCVSVCDGVDSMGTNLGSQVAGAWYLYCTVFFKEMCPEAQQFMDAEFYEKRCGADSGPGLGDTALPSATPSTAESTSPAKTVDSTPTSALVGGTTTIANTSPTNTLVGGTTATASSSSTSSLPKGTTTVKSSVSGTLSSTSTSSQAATGVSANSAVLVSNTLLRWVMIGLGIQLAVIIL